MLQCTVSWSKGGSMHRRVAAALLLMVMVAIGGPSVGAASTVRPEVDGAVQVTANPTPFRAHATPVVAVHPDDPAVVAVASGDARSGRCSLHVSTNAGLSWGEATSPQPPDWPLC